MVTFWKMEDARKITSKTPRKISSHRGCNKTEIALPISSQKKKKPRNFKNLSCSPPLSTN